MRGRKVLGESDQMIVFLVFNTEKHITKGLSSVHVMWSSYSNKMKHEKKEMLQMRMVGHTKAKVGITNAHWEAKKCHPN